MADSRLKLGKYLGTQADHLVYTQNVTIALNIVARSLELGADDEVLTSDHEYGALDRTWDFYPENVDLNILIKKFLCRFRPRNNL